MSGMLKIANDPYAVFEDGKKRIIVLDGSGYFIVRNPDSPMSTWAMGRTNAKEFSASALGNRWLSIQNNGIVLLCDIDEHGDPRWRALRHDLGTFLQGDLSSDGSTVALVASSKGSPPSMHLYKITDTPELELVFSRAEISLAKWHPIDQLLVTVNTEYQLELINSDLQVTSLASDLIGSKSNGESRVKKAVFFRESWSTQQEPTWHVAVQVDGQDSSKLHFVSLSGLASDFAPLELKNRIASVASSTRENVLAIGDVQGNLSIWFAAPSIDRAPRELFTLPGHRGSSIDSLRFTFDGSGLFSSDSARQNLFWKSID
jgi:dipeptidyl aminopeptidase/acylaminoacyl peptidase